MTTVFVVLSSIRKYLSSSEIPSNLLFSIVLFLAVVTLTSYITFIGTHSRTSSKMFYLISHVYRLITIYWHSMTEPYGRTLRLLIGCYHYSYWYLVELWLVLRPLALFWIKFLLEIIEPSNGKWEMYRNLTLPCGEKCGIYGCCYHYNKSYFLRVN